MGTDNKASHAPILLPPRDYDTVHRQKGNLTGIEMRRCLNENIVGELPYQINNRDKQFFIVQPTISLRLPNCLRNNPR